MRTSLLLRAGLVGAAGVAALAFGSPAWANSTISINPGNVPTTAAGFDTHECDANFGGGPFPNQDVWVFVLPGNHSTSGDFVSLTANFGANGTVTITAAANPGNFSNGGPATSKAFIVTPAGFTLVGATAEITGTADFFNLTHTCPASGSPSPSPSMSKSASPSPSMSKSASPSPSASVSPSRSISPTPAASATVPSGPARTGGGGGRPDGSLVWGLGALTTAAGGGMALVWARRRRESA